MRPQIFAEIRRSKLKNIDQKRLSRRFLAYEQAYQNGLDKKTNATFVKILTHCAKFEASLAQCYHQIRGRR